MGGPAPSRLRRGPAVLKDPLVRELLDARLVGVLATRDAGSIHAVPMWYAAGDGCVLLATSSRSRKVMCLERDSRATLVLHDSRPGFEVCGASVAGVVEVVRPPLARELVDLVHRRYVAAEAEADPRVAEFLGSDDVALRLTPTSAVIWDERASEAARVLRTEGWALPLVPTSPRRR